MEYTVVKRPSKKDLELSLSTEVPKESSIPEALIVDDDGGYGDDADLFTEESSPNLSVTNDLDTDTQPIAVQRPTVDTIDDESLELCFLATIAQSEHAFDPRVPYVSNI